MESEMASRLLASSAADRGTLYADVYDAKWRINLDLGGTSPQEQARGASSQLLPTLMRLSRVGESVLEVGCGTGYLSLELARLGRVVTAFDVSSVAVAEAQRHAHSASVPVNFFSSSGVFVPLQSSQFDFIFSVEVLEHLHEDDVPQHLAEVFRLLRPGGRCWVLTPNRLMGGHAAERWGVPEDECPDALDIHLKEWTYRELKDAMATVGFDELRSPWRHRRFQFVPLLPVAMKVWADGIAAFLPRRFRRAFGLAVGTVGCSVVGRKA